MVENVVDAERDRRLAYPVERIGNEDLKPVVSRFLFNILCG